MKQLSGCWRTTCEDTVSAKTDRLIITCSSPGFLRRGYLFNEPLQTAYAAVFHRLWIPHTA